MTPALVLVNSLLAMATLGAARLERNLARRWLRIVGTIGIASGLVAVVGRSSLGAWRTTAMDADVAAVSGAAIACAWGLTISLDIEEDRWWVAGLTASSSAALLLFASTLWVVPALLFWGCLSLSLVVAAARDPGRTWGWIALSDVAVVAAFVTAAMGESWAFPMRLDVALMVPLAAAVLVRTGTLAGAGSMDPIGTASAALTPLMVGSGLILAIRVVDRPVPVAAAVVLVAALAIVLPVLRRRSFQIRFMASWPAAVGLGLCIAAPAVAAVAGVASVLGVSAMVAWPESLDRGRLSRAVVISMVIPNVMFAAVAGVATEAFAYSRDAEGWVERAPWAAIAALLPAVLAVGLAFGVGIARTRHQGGYHPEAVLFSWVLFAASLGAAVTLGAGGVYGALGGGSAVWLVAAAVLAGALAAWRIQPRIEVQPVVGTELGATVPLPAWTRIGCGVAQVSAAGAIAWFTVEGLRTGFL